MWERLSDFKVTGSVAPLTSSVWRYPGVVVIGVMRPVLIAPPILWGIKLAGGLRNLRLGPSLLDNLQELIRANFVYAEADADLPRNKALMRYLGFIELNAKNDRTLYSRSI